MLCLYWKCQSNLVPPRSSQNWSKGHKNLNFCSIKVRKSVFMLHERKFLHFYIIQEAFEPCVRFPCLPNPQVIPTCSQKVGENTFLYSHEKGIILNKKTFIIFAKLTPSGIHISLVVGYGWSKVLFALNSAESSSSEIIWTLLLYSSTKLPIASL